ncbi:hypothetical protein GGR52DRAFT_113163 [Hypoxylon sp. FL1284]|nr:hypothetical protein GGR52DRAFT_113163 [Hypoxylon sp. FL1284]
MPRKYAVTATVAVLISTLASTILAIGFGDIGVLDDAALFPPDHVNAGLGPRLFINGRPPTPALPPDRRKRQTPGQCGADKHSCVEVGPAGATLCCHNSEYCFLDADWQPKCCAIGVTCGSPCAEDALLCNRTVTSTVTVETSAIETSGTITAVASPTQVAACCNRPCSSSFFLCQGAFGGQCCQYGAQCGSESACFFTSSTPLSTIVTPIPPGCTTSQFSCSEGGGCCNYGSTCTSAVSGTMTSHACAPNLTVIDEGGISEGAKVGIGVGVSIGAAAVIGALTWFVVQRRRDARSSRRGDGSAALPADDDDGEDLARPFMRGGPAMSDVTSPSTVAAMMGGPRPPIHETGLAYNYYGPDAVAGPYTDHADGRSSATGVPGRGGGSTEPRSSPGFSTSSNRAAMPANQYPDRPADIRAPVELATDAHGPGSSATLAELEEKGLGIGETVSRPVDEEEDYGPYELDVSPGVSPPPMSAEEAEGHRTLNISPTPPPPPGTDQQEKNSGQK